MPKVIRAETVVSGYIFEQDEDEHGHVMTKITIIS
jgi:hypothetical protein